MTKPPKEIGERIGSLAGETEQLRSDISEVELELLRREHRLFHAITNVLKPDNQAGPRRSAVLQALVRNIFFGGATTAIVLGTSVVGFLGLLVALHANHLFQEQNQRLDVQSHLIEAQRRVALVGVLTETLNAIEAAAPATVFSRPDFNEHVATIVAAIDDALEHEEGSDRRRRYSDRVYLAIAAPLPTDEDFASAKGEIAFKLPNSVSPVLQYTGEIRPPQYQGGMPVAGGPATDAALNHIRDLVLQFELPPGLVNQVVAATQTFRPYYFTDPDVEFVQDQPLGSASFVEKLTALLFGIGADNKIPPVQLIEKPLSPERGLIYLALHNAFPMVGMSEFSSANFRSSDLSDFDLSNWPLAEFDFSDSDFSRTRLLINTNRDDAEIFDERDKRSFEDAQFRCASVTIAGSADQVLFDLSSAEPADIQVIGDVIEADWWRMEMKRSYLPDLVPSIVLLAEHGADLSGFVLWSTGPSFLDWREYSAEFQRQMPKDYKVEPFFFGEARWNTFGRHSGIRIFENDQDEMPDAVRNCANLSVQEHRTF